MDKAERRDTIQLIKALIERARQSLKNGDLIDEFSWNQLSYYQLPSMVDQRERYYVGERYPEIYFTEKEALCLFYLIGGYSQKKVAEKLDIQLTTVASYSRNMRFKMRCASVKELVKKIKETDFMRYRFYLEWLCFMKNLPELPIQAQGGIEL